MHISPIDVLHKQWGDGDYAGFLEKVQQLNVTEG